MTKFRIAAFVAMLSLGATPLAHAATIDFKFLADGAGQLGESAWSTLPITIAPGFTVSITGKDTGAAAYAYLDSGNAGLGVCGALNSGAPLGARPNLKSNICNPSSNDNVKSGETLHFVFNQNTRIDEIWFNNNHDTDFSLSGDSIKIGGASYSFPAANPLVKGDFKATGPYLIAAGASFDIAWETDQFYVGKMVVTAVPEPASALATLLGVFAVGLAGRRKTKN